MARLGRPGLQYLCLPGVSSLGITWAWLGLRYVGLACAALPCHATPLIRGPGTPRARPTLFDWTTCHNYDGIETNAAQLIHNRPGPKAWPAALRTPRRPSPLTSSPGAHRRQERQHTHKASAPGMLSRQFREPLRVQVGGAQSVATHAPTYPPPARSSSGAVGAPTRWQVMLADGPGVDRPTTHWSHSSHGKASPVGDAQPRRVLVVPTNVAPIEKLQNKRVRRASTPRHPR